MPSEAKLENFWIWTLKKQNIKEIICQAKWGQKNMEKLNRPKNAQFGASKPGVKGGLGPPSTPLDPRLLIHWIPWKSWKEIPNEQISLNQNQKSFSWNHHLAELATDNWTVSFIWCTKNRSESILLSQKHLMSYLSEAVYWFYISAKGLP